MRRLLVSQHPQWAVLSIAPVPSSGTVNAIYRLGDDMRVRLPRVKRFAGEDAISSLSTEDQRHLCEVDFDRSAVLLPPGCYLNHSCSPNAMRNGVTVFAWRDISRGEEITVDYRLNAFDDDATWRCECGSHECTGEIVGSFFALPAEKQRLYLPHAPQFIRREYRRRVGSSGQTG